MSLFDKISKSAKAKLASGSKAALEGAGKAFNRLDELGGEARDSLKDWYQQSPAMGTVREFLETRKNGEDLSSDAVDPNADVDEAELVAEPVAEGLGDASVAVQVFGKRSCPWSGRAVRLLEDADIEHQFVELDDPENHATASKLVAETKQNTVPYIYVRGQFLGGFNALDELSRLGQLEARTSQQSDTSSRIKVEVAARPSTDEVPPAANGEHPSDTEQPG